MTETKHTATTTPRTPSAPGDRSFHSSDEPRTPGKRSTPGPRALPHHVVRPQSAGAAPSSAADESGAPWHTLDAATVARRLGTVSSTGLSTQEAEARLALYGPNELRERGARGPWRILADQFASLLVGILIVALVLSVALGDHKDAVVIAAIVVVNALLGFVQEHRAERALAALRRLATPNVRVRRDDQVCEVPSRALVPGDVVLLDAGALVPADGRIVEAAGLRVQEAALTGESEPVDKSTEPLMPVAGDEARDLPLGDRRNMAHKGTVVVAGRGMLLVTATGMATELGRIAALLQRVDRQPTPLQRRLDQLGRALAGVALALVAVVFVAGLARGEAVQVMLLTAISMAVAAVPEGLPAVVTIALALGAQRMLKRRALVRKLAAVETLGSVTVICSDKTGTLTENRMAVAVLATLDGTGERVARTAPADREAGASGGGADGPARALLLTAGALCNDASEASEPPPASSGATAPDAATRVTAEPATPHILGDPTEAALVAAATGAGLRKTALERCLPRVGEVPFDSDRKRMTTIHAISAPDLLPAPLQHARIWEMRGGGSAQLVAFTKGALDLLLEHVVAVWVGDRAEPLTETRRRWIRDAGDELASQGMRVLGVAYRLLDLSDTTPPLASLARPAADATGATASAPSGQPHAETPQPPPIDAESLERELTFIGLVGLMDPPRLEVREAVLTTRAAGVRPVMITGDHPLTADYIARQVALTESAPGFDSPKSVETVGTANHPRILTGAALASVSPDQLAAVVDDVAVYARVSPEHKLTIVRALQARGHVVAMTGDGVNDAPALKQADIGVAMGITGTDVAKEAADVVLLDDNFATIVAAIEEGRVIYDNIRKFIRYMMTTNSAELWVMLIAPFTGMPLPLLPLQILWVNLVTDGPTAVALGFEPAERDTMRRPPHRPDESVFARGMGRQIVWAGCLMAALTLAIGYVTWATGRPAWQTMTFTTLVLAQMANVLAVRSERDSLFQIGVLSNPPLLGAVGLTLLLQAAVVYVPALQDLFHTTALSIGELAVTVAASSAVFFAVETEKWLTRRGQPRQPHAVHEAA